MVIVSVPAALESATLVIMLLANNDFVLETAARPDTVAVTENGPAATALIFPDASMRATVVSLLVHATVGVVSTVPSAACAVAVAMIESPAAIVSAGVATLMLAI